jgi:DNA processing protein
LPDDAPRSAKIPPQAVPRDPAGRLDWLRLARSRRIGPATFVRLIREYGSAADALAALPRIAAEAGVGDYAAAAPAAAHAEWQAAEAAGARPLLLGAPDYPPLLATIADPPPLLWAIGDPGLAARPAVALVGARNASALGARMAARLAAEVGARGLVVVSGLARGIDAAAHRAALATGTVAAHAGGVDVVYPPRSPPRSPPAACACPRCRSAMRRGRRTSPAATASSPALPSASSWSRARCARAA